MVRFGGCSGLHRSHAATGGSNGWPSTPESSLKRGRGIRIGRRGAGKRQQGGFPRPAGSIAHPQDQVGGDVGDVVEPSAQLTNLDIGEFWSVYPQRGGGARPGGCVHVSNSTGSTVAVADAEPCRNAVRGQYP